MDKFRKRRDCELRIEDEESEAPTSSTSKSTERVRKHRISLKVNFNFNKKTVSSPLRQIKHRLNKSLDGKDRAEKVSFFRQVLDSQSPGSKRDISNSVASSSTIDRDNVPDNVVQVYTQLKGKRDKVSNYVKRALLKSLDEHSTKSKVQKLGASYKTFKKAKHSLIEQLLYHCKNKSCTRPPKITEEVKRIIISYYTMDDVSRVVPYKNKTLKFKNCLGNFERIPIRIMELTLHQSYTKFCTIHPELKVDRRSFEKLRPRYVRLKRCAQRLVCACFYHFNIDYLRKSLAKVLKLNDIPCDFLDSNENMVNYLLCDQSSILCILGRCSSCKDFLKLNTIFEGVKCSKECRQKDVDCVTFVHTVKTKQFEKVFYKHKGKEKKKISLVDKDLTFEDFITLFIKQMKGFPQYCFNVGHTKDAYEHAVGFSRITSL